MTPNSTLDTVADYVSDTRVLLQDEIAPYRYDDDSLIVALNVTMLEARRLRADLFLRHNGKAPSFTSASVETNEPVHIEAPFRLAIVYGMGGHALARDQEDYQDTRATAFMALFEYMLTGKRSGPPPVVGGDPPGK